MARVTADPGVDAVEVPLDGSLGEATFTRAGGDLFIVTTTGSSVVVKGWFDAADPPSLVTPTGQVLDAAHVDRLVGPLAPGQVAQLDLGTVQPIGQAVTVEGTVSVLRADGTAAALEAGSPLFPGDIVDSGPGAAAGVTLVDGTTLAMAENARLVLDDVIYAGGAEDSLSLTVLEGVFTLTSGEIAAGDPEAMTITSPSAVAGVRGTRVGIEIGDDGQETWFLLPDGTGHVGSYSLTHTLTGETLLLTQSFQAVTPSGGALRLLVLTPESIVNTLGRSLLIEPENDTRAGNVEPDEEELARLAEALAAIAPAAGSDAAESSGDAVNVVLDPALWSFLNATLPGSTFAFTLSLADDDEGDGGDRPERLEDLVRRDGGAEPDPAVRLGDGGEVFVGGDGPDTVIGGAGADQIFGGGGDDVLDGGAGGDLLDGGPGDDAVFGGTGDDLIIGGSGEGDDLLVGGPGADTVKFSSATLPITVDLSKGTAVGDPAIGVDVLAGIEHVIGGQAGDTLIGNGAANSLSGGGGDDVLRGGAGDDVLVGDAGDDTAVFAGSSDRYSVGPDGPTVAIGDTTGALGTDVLRGVETARFADRDLVFDGVNDAPTIGPLSDVGGTVVHTTFLHDFGDLPPVEDIDPAAPNGVPDGALIFDHDHGVTVTFLSASTAYSDILGMYHIALDGTIGSVEIVYADTSENALDPVTFDVAAGERIGFFVVADGATLNDLDSLGEGEFAFLAGDDTVASIATANPRLVFLGDDGSTTDILFHAGDGVFHSAASGLNPDGEVHVASGLAEGGGLVLAFEAQPIAIDFDDAVIRIDVDPAVVTSFDPIDLVPAIALGDVDGVGLVAASVTLAGQAGDVLDLDGGLAATLGLTVTATEGGFTIAGAGSFDDYETLFETLTLSNDNPLPGDRTVTLGVVDSAGAASSFAVVAVDVDEQSVDSGAEGFTVFDSGSSGAGFTLGIGAASFEAVAV